VFAAPEAVLGFAGAWDGRLVVQREGAYDVNDRFGLVVADRPPTHQEHGTRGRAWPPDAVTIGAAVVAAALTLALFSRSGRELDASRRLLADTPRPPDPEPARR
jgi:hypothetical protein